MKNLHLPLPDRIYSELRAEAERTQVPATTLAREAIDWWLRQRLRKARHDAIAAFAEEMAGSNVDRDTDLESAGVEHLMRAVEESFALCHQVTTLDRAKLTKRIGALPPDVLRDIEEGLKAAMDLE